MSDIPEGATHTLDGFYFKIKGQVWFYYSSKPQRFNWRLSMLQNIYIENNATPIKQDKEMIYTKEMFNNSETPKVGMQIGVRFDKASKPNYGKLIALTNQYIILLEDEAQERHYHRGTWIFSPVDTRTDTEKAVDDLADGISASYSIDQSFKEDARGMLDLIKAGKIHGLTFTGDK